MTSTRRSPRQLASAFEALAQELAPRTVLGDAQSAWRDTVGQSIAERAWPVSERGGVLTVSCESSVWAQELDLISGPILERLNVRLGQAHIVRLRCVSTPPPDPFSGR